LKKKATEIPAWKQHVLENQNKSNDDKRNALNQKLITTLETLKTLYGPVFISAVKSVEEGQSKESGPGSDKTRKDLAELKNRLKGLRLGFDQAYYTALDQVLGQNVITRQEIVQTEMTEQAEALEKVMAASNQSSRLPKGFGKWDLKQMKLNESRPEAHDNKWVEYWSLKGESAVGRILYNEEKDLHYFRPHNESAVSTFPLTSHQGRKLTREGRNYYFRKTTPPAGEY